MGSECLTQKRKPSSNSTNGITQKEDDVYSKLHRWGISRGGLSRGEFLGVDDLAMPHVAFSLLCASSIASTEKGLLIFGITTREEDANGLICLIFTFSIFKSANGR